MKLVNMVVLCVYGIVLSGCTTCLNFDALTLGSQFNVGDVVSTPELNIRVEKFQWANGTWTSSGTGKVDSRNYARGSGMEFNLNNVNLHPQHAHPVDKITFKFGELGGNNNIRINGVFQNVNDLISLNNTVIGGAHVFVTASRQGNNWYGDITIEGHIRDFSIGGQELWIDNYCYKLADSSVSEFKFHVTSGGAGVTGPGAQGSQGPAGNDLTFSIDSAGWALFEDYTHVTFISSPYWPSTLVGTTIRLTNGIGQYDFTTGNFSNLQFDTEVEDVNGNMTIGTHDFLGHTTAPLPVPVGTNSPVGTGLQFILSVNPSPSWPIDLGGGLSGNIALNAAIISATDLP